MPYGKGSRPPRRESDPAAALGFAMLYGLAVFAVAILAVIIL